jgi:hypothetical protein
VWAASCSTISAVPSTVPAISSVNETSPPALSKQSMFGAMPAKPGDWPCQLPTISMS